MEASTERQKERECFLFLSALFRRTINAYYWHDMSALRYQIRHIRMNATVIDHVNRVSLMGIHSHVFWNVEVKQVSCCKSLMETEEKEKKKAHTHKHRQQHLLHLFSANQQESIGTQSFLMLLCCCAFFVLHYPFCVFLVSLISSLFKCKAKLYPKLCTRKHFVFRLRVTFAFTGVRDNKHFREWTTAK